MTENLVGFRCLVSVLDQMPHDMDSDLCTTAILVSESLKEGLEKPALTMLDRTNVPAIGLNGFAGASRSTLPFLQTKPDPEVECP